MNLTWEQTLALGNSELIALHPDNPENLKAKRSKYGAKPTVYNGIRFDSKGEANHARKLDADKAAGLIEWWIRQVPFTLGVPENRIRVDFLVVFRWNGSGSGVGIRVDEFKGADTQKFIHDCELWEVYGPCPMHVVRRGKTTEIIWPRGAKI